MTDTPKTLIDAVRYYTDPKVCFETMLAVKWPDGKICCPKCGGETIGVIASRSMLQCKSKGCRKQFSPTAGTMFDGTKRIDIWIVAVWCIATKFTISDARLAAAMKVRQPTAWKIRRDLKIAMELI